MMEYRPNHEISTRVEEWTLRGKPKQNGVDWPLDPWINLFPEHKDFLTSLKYRNAGLIDRDLVHKVTMHENSKQNYLAGFLPAMIWGYASVAYGPTRVRKIFDQEKTEKAIADCVSKISANDLAGAFDSLITNGPKGLGCAFGSKYLYFASPSSSRVEPLILDSLMNQALTKWCGVHFDPLSATSETYLEYITFMANVAKVHEVSSGELEEVLFTEIAKELGNQSWANSQAPSELSESDFYAWALLLASEIALRDSNIVVTRTHPGGGQYDCISIRSTDDDKRLWIDLNVKGSLHVIANDETVLSCSWDALISTGIQKTLKLWARPLGIREEVDLSLASNGAKAFRFLASFNIKNHKNSDYRVVPIFEESVRESLISWFPREAISKLPDHPLHWPKESWLWAITYKNETSRIYEIAHGEAFRADGGGSAAPWPDLETS